MASTPAGNRPAEDEYAGKSENHPQRPPPGAVCPSGRLERQVLAWRDFVRHVGDVDDVGAGVLALEVQRVLGLPAPSQGTPVRIEREALDHVQPGAVRKPPV